MNKKLPLSLLGVCWLATACTLAPNYHRPTAPVPGAWPGGAEPGEARPDAGRQPAQNLNWREFFTDPKLQRLIGLALTNNRDLRLASLNVEQARALYGIQRAQLWPAIDAAGGLSRQRAPADLSTPGLPLTTSDYSATLGAASWELDFFGRIRSLKNEALEQYFASEQARRSARIALISSVALADLTLAADQENLKLAEVTFETQRASYQLIRRQHDLGLVTDLDLCRAQTPMDTARRDMAGFKQQAAQDQNALNLLLGCPVAEEWLPANLDAITPPRELAPGLTSEVLLNRPDVLQAEDLLQAANADIGAARAAFFPRISLTAAIGTASSDLSGLFKAGQGTWSYAPQLVLPIFDARTWSAHRAATVRRDMAVTQYEKAIQSAFREVADTLAVRGNVEQQLAAQQSLAEACSESYRLATSRYDRGIDSYLNVLDAQRSLYAAQQGVVSLRLAKLANQTRLYAVLGGGGQTEPAAGPDATPPARKLQ
jgi:multidrug efflux system outer membrane protein